MNIEAEQGQLGLRGIIQGGEMIRPTEVEPRDGFRVWICYSDGASGEVDLSYLAGRGVFKSWLDRACFEAVHIAPAGGIAWGDDAELCPDALYMRLTGKSFAELMPEAQFLVENA